MDAATEDALVKGLELRMWIEQLDAKKNGRADWPTRRLAGERVCELLGIAQQLRAVSAGGALAMPPPWPTVDIVPTGGGPGFVQCEVRTLHKGFSRSVGIRIAAGKPGTHQAEIAEALDRGRRQLRKLIDG